MEIALLLLAALLAANVWATRRVLPADEFAHRKVLLLIGIWLMPILDPATIHEFWTGAASSPGHPAYTRSNPTSHRLCAPATAIPKLTCRKTLRASCARP
jgi:hypothetical protein